MQVISRPSRYTLKELRQAMAKTQPTDKLIPRPKGAKMFYRVLAQLANAMNATHPTLKSFEIFKKVIKKHMFMLDCTRYRHDQPDNEWEDFLQEVLLSEPILKRYDNCWPVEFYFNTSIRARVAFARQSSTEHRKEPSRANATHVLDEAKRTTMPAPSLSSLTTHAIHLSACPVPEYQDETGNSRLDTTLMISTCFLCNPPTTLDSSSKNRFSAFFANDKEFLQTLASYGIRFDQHFETLLRMDCASRERLVVSIPSKEIKPSAKYWFLALLECVAAKHTADDLSGLSDAMTIAQLPCHNHQPVDISGISSGIRKFLQIHGLGELVPAFALMEIFTESDFHEFGRLNGYSRASLIKNKKVQLSYFQEVMLNQIFG